MIRRQWRQLVPLFSRFSFRNATECRHFSEEVSVNDDNAPIHQYDPKQYLDIKLLYEQIRNKPSVDYKSGGVASYRRSPGLTHWADSFFSNSYLYDPLSQKFINKMMEGGNKSKSQRLFSQAMERIRTKLIKAAHISHPNSLSPPNQIDPVKYFHRALFNVMPLMEITRVGSMQQFSVPFKMRDSRRLFKGMSWLIRHAKDIGASNEKMDSKLAKAFELAYNKEGNAYQTKIQLNKQCVANRSHASFRFAARRKTTLSTGKRRRKR